MLQIKCNCGRIAEVRHRKNGKKLAYSHCVACGGSAVSAAAAAIIEENSVENLGVKGEFFSDENESKIDEKNDEFIPSEEELPENVEQEIKDDEKDNNDENKPSNLFSALKIVGGIAIASLLGFGVYKVKGGK